MTENQLKEGLKNKSSYIFSYAFTRYYSELCMYSMTIVKDSESAKDIVQDLFITIWKNGDKTVVKGSLKQYLYTSARNRCFDFLKHQKVKSKYIEFVDPKESLYTPEDWVIEKEIMEALSRSLSNLSPRCKETFMLSRMSGLKNKEIAIELGLSRRTVEHHISTALKGLRINLKPFLAAS